MFFIFGFGGKSDAEKDDHKTSKAVIFGICGIVFAWLFALVGHVLSIMSIVAGVKEKKEVGAVTGLALGIVGEIFAIISSVVGVIMNLGI